jgi:hypothetical protein
MFKVPKRALENVVQTSFMSRYIDRSLIVYVFCQRNISLLIIKTLTAHKR